MAVPLSNLSATWATSTSSVNTAIKMNVTDTSSAANSKLIDLQVDGDSKFSVDKFGNTNTKIIIVDQIYANNLSVAGNVDYFLIYDKIEAVNTSSVLGRTAYDQANTAYNQANIAYNQANTAYNQANLAFSRASASYSNYQIFTANGILNLPENVNTVFAIVIGGGGAGGASSAAATGGEGGYGGITAGYIKFASGANIFVGVGTGGVASNSAAGLGGGTSNLGSLTATGGAGGTVAGGTGRAAAGVGSGGTINTNSTLYFGGLTGVAAMNTALVLAMSGSNLVGKSEILYINGLLDDVPQGINAQSNVPYQPFISTLRPGAAGTGEAIGLASNNASGGADGAVLVFY